MTSAEERIVLTRWSPLMAIGVLVVTATLAAGPLLTLLSGTGTRIEQAFMGVLTVLFAIPFLWTLWRVPKTLRGMGIVVDEKGIHPFDGRRRDTIAWSECREGRPPLPSPVVERPIRASTVAFDVSYSSKLRIDR